MHRLEIHNICAHCIAVAEDNELEQFLLWFASFKGKECNLTSIMKPINMHAGSKKPPRKKYGDITQLPVDHKTDIGDIYNDHS